MQVSSFPMFIFVTRALVSGLWALARNGHPNPGGSRAAIGSGSGQGQEEVVVVAAAAAAGVAGVVGVAGVGVTVISQYSGC